MHTDEKKGNGWALAPFAVFVAVYLGAGLFLQHRGVEQAFYQFPSATAMFLALLLAFAMTKGSMEERFRVFARGAANEEVLTMLVIYLLAGAFSSAASAMGGLAAVIDLGMRLVPVRYLAAGMFLISAFMGTATGSSMGTISAIVPIAVGVAQKSGLAVPLMMGACVGGAMFGDNLSMISDTTIAATRSQGCRMQDKFRVNFLIALPAALATLGLLLLVSGQTAAPALGNGDIQLLKVLPYLLVLVLALLGVNVFLVLTAGIFVAGGVGMLFGSLDVFQFAQSIWNGFTGMNEVFFLTLFCGGMSRMVAHNGGIVWLIRRLRAGIRGQRSAQLSIAALVSLADCATANNTVAIVVTGGVARDISREYRVDPRRTASLLDVFACVFQGLIPYGAQLLAAASLANVAGVMVAPTQIVPYLWYCMLLAGFGLLSIAVPYADGYCRRHPWSWEQARAETEGTDRSDR